MTTKEIKSKLIEFLTSSDCYKEYYNEIDTTTEWLEEGEAYFPGDKFYGIKKKDGSYFTLSIFEGSDYMNFDTFYETISIEF